MGIMWFKKQIIIGNTYYHLLCARCYIKCLIFISLDSWKLYEAFTVIIAYFYVRKLRHSYWMTELGSLTPGSQESTLFIRMHYFSSCSGGFLLFYHCIRLILSTSKVMMSISVKIFYFLDILLSNFSLMLILIFQGLIE